MSTAGESAHVLFVLIDSRSKVIFTLFHNFNSEKTKSFAKLLEVAIVSLNRANKLRL